LRSGLLAAMSGVAVAGVGGTASGVSSADGGVEAGTSGVVTAEGRDAAGTSGVVTAEGREGSGCEATAGTGADDGRGAGVEARGAGLEEGRGVGVEARGAGVDGDATASLGTAAGAGISSAPHSESISSVGGAMDGIGGLALTRSLSDRLSVIALPSAFHGPAHKSSARRGVRPKSANSSRPERTFPPRQEWVFQFSAVSRLIRGGDPASTC